MAWPAGRRTLVDMLYDDLFVRLERARWNFTDEIDFTTIDHSLLTDQWIHDLRQICLTELSALYATEMFLRDFYTDIDFCSFVSIWFYEEMKHHMVLRKYLEALRGDLRRGEGAPELRLTFAEGPAIETLTMHFCGEQRLAHWYTAFSKSAPSRCCARSSRSSPPTSSATPPATPSTCARRSPTSRTSCPRSCA